MELKSKERHWWRLSVGRVEKWTIKRQAQPLCWPCCKWKANKRQAPLCRPCWKRKANKRQAPLCRPCWKMNQQKTGAEKKDKSHGRCQKKQNFRNEYCHMISFYDGYRWYRRYTVAQNRWKKAGSFRGSNNIIPSSLPSCKSASLRH